MHSPFIFGFIEHVLNNKSTYEAPQQVEALRRKLSRDKEVLTIEDLGAGSRISASKKRTVQELATTAVKPKKFGQLFYRLVKHYQPAIILELGTSLGVTTSYMRLANPEAKVLTIEGSEAIYEKALSNFEALGLKNIKAYNGNFDHLLPEVLRALDHVDLAYIDGNHRYQPTVDYFRQLLPKVHNGSILVFDDIHWSEEMEAAWKEIKGHPGVQCTVDLFFLGFVFFRKEFKEKQHFSIRY
jgi:predicted O-methyltransferase YrrM